MSDSAEILFERRGAIGLVTLNRPKALNALTLDMIRLFDPQLRAWDADPEVKAVVIQGAGEKAFCAGGDVVSLYEAGKAARAGTGDGSAIRAFFSEEYVLNRRIKRLSKPYVALIDGISMGGGVGLSVHGTHRIVTERTLFAMPETGIGLYPDVGGTYFLPRLPGQVGTWLGLTGDRLKAADLLAIGAADAFVPSAGIEALVADLAAGTPPDEAVAKARGTAGDSTVAANRAAIDRCYAFDTVEAIVKALEAEGTDWAAAQLATLNRVSPTSLKVTLTAIRRGAKLDFDDCMIQELRLSLACLAGDDFYEGIRAALVDKDKSPKWKPAELSGVGPSDVERHFSEPAGGDLAFKD
ncbi:enoyl-CoA hydratase/isomerase family protein [Azospirillum doebereinerae]|uniref:enoyl-CoA hydratase/isomerase family protein n=1 Tax=Azospirillum doebereinerae TaxID=92933 RepID=UPI001EE63533|nr:enoyl-CoA hydratase/isomerase family protein [Azospirillum doebereinerae]MCG5241143.1 enoyl-CoA hydratase/isomerase family protein [Azospirillum doebereinerae]